MELFDVGDVELVLLCGGDLVETGGLVVEVLLGQGVSFEVMDEGRQIEVFATDTLHE